MRVVSVDAPGLDHPIHRAVVPRSSNVVHDFVVTIFDNRCTHARGDIVECIVPTHPDPVASAALTGPLHWIQDSFRVVDLVDRRRSLCTRTPTASWVYRVAFEAPNLAVGLINVGEQPTTGFTVETDRWH